MWILLIALFVPALARPSTHIIGGRPVTQIGRYPWQALIEFEGTGFSYCGGVLVKRDWVVTAAHCANAAVHTMHVILGLHNLDNLGQGAPQYYRAHLGYAHPQYNVDSRYAFPYDIGVMRLETMANTGSPFISTINMAPADEDGAGDYSGTECVMTGWGMTENGMPGTLQEAEGDVLTQAECDLYGIPGATARMHVCMGDKQGADTGACSGDSGGPLQCEIPQGSNNWILIGTTSFGFGACDTTRPSVFARISASKRWIETVIGPQ